MNRCHNTVPDAASASGCAILCDFRHSGGASRARVLPIKHDVGQVFSARRQTSD
jgi:hypothetical protein